MTKKVLAYFFFPFLVSVPTSLCAPLVLNLFFKARRSNLNPNTFRHQPSTIHLYYHVTKLDKPAQENNLIAARDQRLLCMNSRTLVAA